MKTSLRTEKYKNTIFVALPKEAWRAIESGCGCSFCKSHPDIAPQWDTLVVDATGKSRYTTTCHYPEFSSHRG
jgi:hypothetical protein